MESFLSFSSKPLSHAMFSLGLLMLFAICSASPGFIDLSNGANRPMDDPYGDFSATLVGLNDTQMAFSLQEFQPCGAATVHYHSNSDEVVYSINATGVASVVLLNGTAVTFRYGPGDLFINPRGYMHWNMQDVNSTGVLVTYFNNQHNTLGFAANILNGLSQLQLQQMLNISSTVAGATFKGEPDIFELQTPCEAHGGNLDFEEFGLVDGSCVGLLHHMGPTTPDRIGSDVIITPGGVAEPKIAVGDFFSYVSNRPIDESPFNRYNGNFPLLGGLQMSFSWLGLKPCATARLHLHPNADETLYAIAGSGIAGYVGPGGNTLYFPFKQYDLFVFPRGLYHFVYNNNSDKDLTIVASYNNQQFSTAWLASKSGKGVDWTSIPISVLASSMGVSEAQAQAAFVDPMFLNSENLQEVAGTNDGSCPDLTTATMIDPAAEGLLTSLIPEGGLECFGSGICPGSAFAGFL